MKAFYSELPFASLLAYSPRGQTEVSLRSQEVRAKIKAGNLATIELAMTRISEVSDETLFHSFLGRDVSFVPAPGSSPRVQGALSVPDQLAKALVTAGFGFEVYTCLVRTQAVPKSAFAQPGNRPDVSAHMASMAVEPVLIPPRKITIVDDFVTKGRTLFAAASVLSKAFPNAEIRGFALVRTMGLIDDIEEILAPCVGKITRSTANGDVRRVP